uniref:Uncharacterized protein n=1 Tax=Arundo donax TaxID=35708 RepID=A0A0A9FJK5_ARUDO
MDGKCSHTQEEDDKLEEDEAPINVQDPVQVLSKGPPKKLKSFQDIKKIK